MLKKRSREYYEELPAEEIIEQPINNTINKPTTTTIQNISNTSRIIKNIKPDTEFINDKTLNILMNSSKANSKNNNNNNSNNKATTDIEFSNMNPNIPSDYFSCQNSTKGSCRNCNTEKKLRECPSCYGRVCCQCAHCCETCTEVICSFCCVTDDVHCDCDECSYSQSHEVDYCIDCNK
ncbi:hypothetical protein RB653_002872 [Dictyostelium firmibasis]|uniref:Apoptosis regulatory protein Siva n=1 Tax=Dictyostelium firmibasis TaxID=79012 RepID=A0AAN7YNF0_9MYCE